MRKLTDDGRQLQLENVENATRRTSVAAQVLLAVSGKMLRHWVWREMIFYLFLKWKFCLWMMKTWNLGERNEKFVGQNSYKVMHTKNIGYMVLLCSELVGFESFKI